MRHMRQAARLCPQRILKKTNLENKIKKNKCQRTFEYIRRYVWNQSTLRHQSACSVTGFLVRSANSKLEHEAWDPLRLRQIEHLRPALGLLFVLLEAHRNHSTNGRILVYIGWPKLRYSLIIIFAVWLPKSLYCKVIRWNPAHFIWNKIYKEFKILSVLLHFLRDGVE